MTFSSTYLSNLYMYLSLVENVCVLLSRYFMSYGVYPLS